MEKDRDDAGGHEVCHRPGEHGAESEPSKIVAAIGDECTYSADLHADAASDVREAAAARR